MTTSDQPIPGSPGTSAPTGRAPVQPGPQGPPWWLPQEIPAGHTLAFRVGPLSLLIRREPGEWRVAWERGDDPLDLAVHIGDPTPGPDLLDHPAVTRFAHEGASAQVALQPRLADRSIISRPERPFVLLGGQEVEAHVSTPLWVAVQVGDPPELLLELPTVRPSDTWFGPDTMTGELAYTNRTALRLRLSETPHRPHRAVTAVRLRNLSSDPLAVERLNLPVKHLSLAQGQDGTLLTERVVYERTGDSDQIRLRLRDSMTQAAAQRRAQESGPRTRLCAPREVLSERLSVRALTSLFG